LEYFTEGNTAFEFYETIQQSRGFTGNLHLEMAKKFLLSLAGTPKNSKEFLKVTELHELSVTRFGSDDLGKLIACTGYLLIYAETYH